MSKNKQDIFYKRLKQLGGVKSANNPVPSLSNSTLIDYKRSESGVALGIVKENHNYFIKTSNSKNEQLGAHDFAYIGGIENKFKYQYSSLSEADKNRNFYIKTLNESTSKKFKFTRLNENEDIAKAQTNADALNAEKAQGEADKNMKNDSAAASVNPQVVDATKESSVKAIAVDPVQGDAKVVDDTKESSTKAIAVDPKQAKSEVVDDTKESSAKPIVVEAAIPGEEDQAAAPVAPEASAAPASPEASAEPAAGGDEDADLDAAASALADMGAADSAEPAVGGAEASLSPEAGAEPAPVGDGTGAPTDAEGSVKDIEKLMGKVTQKIRSTVLTPELTLGFLKSTISAFEDKINDLEHEDRKELANSIMKDKAEAGLDSASPEGGLDGSSETTPDEEKDIEEAINQHLAEMGITGEAEPAADEKLPFKQYVSDRGYDPEKVEEISLMEMVGLVNGYANECADSMEKADLEGVADYMTPEVSEMVQASGNESFNESMKPFGEKIKKNKKTYATEAVIPSINEEFGSEDDSEEETEVSADVETPAVADEPSEKPEEKPEIQIAPASDTIAIGAPTSSTSSNGGGETKSVTVDLNNNTINMTLSESAEGKLRKIVQKKIAEQLEGKKSPINESKKSELSKMIDELVNEAIQNRRAAIEKRLMKK